MPNDEPGASAGVGSGGSGGATTGQGQSARPSELTRARNIGVGCFTTFIGFWSGGMIAVLLGRLVESTRGSTTCEGLPICNWYVYWWIGAVLGASSLPVLVMRRLRRRDQAAHTTK